MDLPPAGWYNIVAGVPYPKIGQKERAAMRSFPVVYMRGGTSKGAIFHKKDLPENRDEWDSIFLQTMGCPDPKQIDGLGGMMSSNNKIVVVWKSEMPGVDVEYLVGQVVVGRMQVDYGSNCGNMTSMVGPFAVDEGLMPAAEPFTRARLYNHNTNKRIDAVFPVKDGRFVEDGDCEIAGVDGTASKIEVRFLRPDGSRTGKLLPTGNAVDLLDVPGVGPVEASLIDVASPLVLVRAKDLGLTGQELPDAFNGDQELLELMERIRGTASVKMGFAKDLRDAADNVSTVPRIGFVSPPQDYTGLAGQKVKAAEMDLCVRMLSVFKMHKASPLTAATAISVAVFVEGSVANQVLGRRLVPGDEVRIAHPGGVMKLSPSLTIEDGTVRVEDVTMVRTARRIMEGTLFIRN